MGKRKLNRSKIARELLGKGMSVAEAIKKLKGMGDNSLPYQPDFTVNRIFNEEFKKKPAAKKAPAKKADGKKPEGKTSAEKVVAVKKEMPAKKVVKNKVELDQGELLDKQLEDLK